MQLGGRTKTFSATYKAFERCRNGGGLELPGFFYCMRGYDVFAYLGWLSCKVVSLSCPWSPAPSDSPSIKVSWVYQSEPETSIGRFSSWFIKFMLAERYTVLTSGINKTSSATHDIIILYACTLPKLIHRFILMNSIHVPTLWGKK